jgi:hypothetical protein
MHHNLCAVSGLSGHALTPLLRAIQTKFRILVSTISVQQFYGDPFVLQEIALEKPYANFIQRVSV